MEIGGIKLYDIILRLHDDGAILQLHGESVVEGAVRDVVVSIVAHYFSHHTLADDQRTDAVTGTDPHIMVAVFYNGVYYIVIQSVDVSIYYGLSIIRHIQSESSVRTFPSPASAVAEKAVDATRQTVQTLLGIFLQHGAILSGLGVVHEIHLERRSVRFRIEQSPFPGTYPHTALQVERDVVNAGLYHLMVYTCQLFVVVLLACLDIECPISLRGSNIEQVAMNSHIVQSVRHLHHHTRLTCMGSDMHQHRTGIATTYLIKPHRLITKHRCLLVFFCHIGAQRRFDIDDGSRLVVEGFYTAVVIEEYDHLVFY